MVSKDEPIETGESALGRLTSVRERLIRSGRAVADADGATRELFPVAIGPKEGRALSEYVTAEGATRTFETGLGFGMSTLFICEALLTSGHDFGHVAMDPYQFVALPTHTTSYAGIGLQLLEEAGVRDLVEFYPEESQVVLPRLLDDGRGFDLAFLDANHRFEGVFLDLYYSGRLLRDGGIVFVDDVQLRNVQSAVSFFTTNLGWNIEDRGREAGHEWVVLRTRSQDVFSRPYDEFMDF